MTVFEKGLIDELVAELLNQYLKIVWLEDVLCNGFGRIAMDVTCAFEEGANPMTIQDGLKLATDIQVNVTGKNNLGSQSFQTQLHFVEEEYDCLYQEMGERCKDPRYDFLKVRYGYSISDLISIVDQLAALRENLDNLNNKQKLKAYKEILHGYIGLDTLTYGINNPSLKQRIVKGRSIQGEYQRIVKEKKQIFFDVLVKQVQLKGKYNNVSKAVNENMDEIMCQFEIYDERWIEIKQKASLNRIIKLNEEKLDRTLTVLKIVKIEKEIMKLSAFMQQLDDVNRTGFVGESIF